MKRNSKHLLAIRLITGITFCFFGFLHVVNQENFTNLLRTAEIPMVYFNAIFIPLTDFLLGLFLISGLFTRLASAIGLIYSFLFIWITIFMIQLDPSKLPDGLSQKPAVPHLFITLILTLFCLYLTCFGGGAFSLDNRLEK